VSDCCRVATHALEHGDSNSPQRAEREHACVLTSEILRENRVEESSRASSEA